MIVAIAILAGLTIVNTVFLFIAWLRIESLDDWSIDDITPRIRDLEARLQQLENKDEAK